MCGSRKFVAPQVIRRDAGSQIRITDQVMKHSPTTAEGRILSVCIVENISFGLIDLLRTAWDLDATFFVQYATNPKKEELWRKLDTSALYQEGNVTRIWMAYLSTRHRNKPTRDSELSPKYNFSPLLRRYSFDYKVYQSYFIQSRESLAMYVISTQGRDKISANKDTRYFLG